MLYLLPLAGLAIGLLVSVMGGGGGIFYVIILTGLFHFPVPVTASSSLATIIPTTLTAFLSHYRQGHIRLEVARWVILGAMAGTVAGSFVTAWIPEPYQKKMLGLTLLAMLVPMARRARKAQPAVTRSPAGSSDGAGESSLTGSGRGDAPGDGPSSAPSPRRHVLAIAYGLLAGIMSGMVGISGTPPVIAGLYALGLKAKEVVGTSLMVLLAIGITGVVAHSALGEVNWPIVFLLGAGTVTGAFLGPLLLSRANPAALEKVYGPFFLLLVGFFGVYMLMG
ncbi:sulfite exporter TauE/SafE family protein [Carboxydochorda subterranea]|uniref:Probable membrane transporter protein n=1 Tax=Carboxydichorda subterranea TaxID=3109565 RepID=A0ABZ1BWZ4_9FIRM|nr:sulfite exporter TauE/SafE family protein [Limnochorda sp. L945t]WRP17297.1 sulfite exporter TauE/SafE family protein [Limnochorda sp. L945t]